MRPIAFSNPGRFWRGNLHTHTTRSDGLLSPEEVCRRYHAEGYDFVSLTDHFVGLYDYPLVDTRAQRTANFTTIPGAELHSGFIENGDIWHVLAVGLPDDFAPSNSPDFRARADQETGPQLAQRAADAGAFVAIAHPEWSGLTNADARSITAAHAVEVYNQSCRVDADRPHGFAALDILLTEGRKLNLIATDDAHFSVSDAFGGWVMVKAEENSPDALVEALKSGAMYSSTGPEIHDISLIGDDLSVRCSAAVSILVLGDKATSQGVFGSSMTRAEITLKRVVDSKWLRVVVVDAAGNRAWSNPIWRV